MQIKELFISGCLYNFALLCYYTIFQSCNNLRSYPSDNWQSPQLRYCVCIFISPEAGSQTKTQ